jgi:hypothetical protein
MIISTYLHLVPRANIRSTGIADPALRTGVSLVSRKHCLICRQNFNRSPVAHGFTK